jgi:hypothetical protein
VDNALECVMSNITLDPRQIFINTFKDPDEPEAAISKNNKKEAYLYDYLASKKTGILIVITMDILLMTNMTNI